MSNNKNDNIVMGKNGDFDKVNVDAQLLFNLAEEKTQDSYGKLTNEVIEIYQNRELSDIEYEIANDIILTLLRQAEIDLREALSERLSIQEDIPQELILYLAHDDISVASHIILNSVQLSDIDLITLIREQGKKHWQTIAKREQLNEIITTRLIKTGDIDTAVNLLHNTSTDLSKKHMMDLASTGLKSEKIHVPLLNRKEISNEVALKLYIYVSKELRSQILDKYNVNKQQLDRTLEELLNDLQSACHNEWDVTEEMMSIASAFKERNEISSGLLIRTLRRGQLSFFSALMSTWMDMDIKTTKQTIQNDDGRSFAIACRSLGIIKSEFATIFLLSSPLHSSTSVGNQTNLLKVLQFFDKITTSDAQKVIKSWSKKS